MLTANCTSQKRKNRGDAKLPNLEAVKGKRYGAYIKRKLKQLGRTQYELADACGMTKDHISKIIVGKYYSKKGRALIRSVIEQWERIQGSK